MEKRLNKKAEEYVSKFKSGIKDKVTTLGLLNNPQVNQLLQFIYDQEPLEITKDDLKKRKRVKNVVPMCDRCASKRANGEQCTRRKKEGCDYCGTHQKGRPHGIVDSENETKITSQKIEVWAEDIQGIMYYIDKNNNVYQTEDIVSNKSNPNIIAKYVKVGNVYSIPEFNI
jgi:hypothetical protein